jgi:hypothetical protein
MRTKSWSIEQLREAALVAKSYREVLRLLGLRMAGGNYNLMKRTLREHGIVLAQHKGQGWNKGGKRMTVTQRSLDELLVTNSTYQSHKLKLRLFKEGRKKPSCEECGWAEVSKDGRRPLELDHINGVPSDNRLENLRILCPNCHSLKPTHRGLNKKRF